jgi:hypothetical protein
VAIAYRFFRYKKATDQPDKIRASPSATPALFGELHWPTWQPQLVETISMSRAT